MKSKFTTIIMFFIIIAIIISIGLLSVIVLKDMFGIDIFNNQSTEKVGQFNDNEFWDGEDDNLNYNDNEYETSNDAFKQLEIHKTPISSSNGSYTGDYDNSNINYDNIVVNKYFYKQLNSYSQTIYRAMESNKEQMKSGTYKVQLGSTFSDVLSGENGQEKLGNYYQSAIEAYIYDNPDVFYLNPSKMYLNIETIRKANSVTYNVYISNGNSSNYLIDEFNSKEKVQEALNEIESVRNNIVSRKTGNTYQDIKMVHDFLIDNIEYDSTLSSENIYNIYGALINNKCVCEGYAKAFKYLLDGMGIECNLVIGKATNSKGLSENHAWNYVKIDNSYYAVDVTWDDPIVIGGYATQSMKNKYFLKGRKQINSDHFPSGQFTEDGQIFEYPELSNDAY